MDKAEVALIAELKEKGLSGAADNILLILDSRDKRITALENKIDEGIHRYGAASQALNHFTELELRHYTEMKDVHKQLLEDAFPDGDPVGHKRFHESEIKAAEEKAKLYRTLQTEVVKRGFFWAVIVLLGLLWLGFETKFRGWLGI